MAAVLTLVPCNHFWLEVKATAAEIIAICKFMGCRKRGTFSHEAWGNLAKAGHALNKPVRV